MDITFKSLGTIHTPYFAFNTPHQPISEAPGDFWITLDPDYASALKTLNTFKYIYVLYHLDQVTPPIEMLTRSPWAPETEIGLFASRSPKRPNPIGLSIVKVMKINGNEITISGIDVYNGTPLLDIKPYVQFLDSKEDANNGWFDTLPDKDHTMAHILGLSHQHEHEHEPQDNQKRYSHNNRTAHEDGDHNHNHSHHHEHVHRYTKHYHEHND